MKYCVNACSRHICTYFAAADDSHMFVMIKLIHAEATIARAKNGKLAFGPLIARRSNF